MSNRKCLRILFSHKYTKHKIRVSNRETKKYVIHFLFYYNYSYVNDFWATVDDANVLITLNMKSRIYSNRSDEFAFMLFNNMLLLVR